MFLALVGDRKLHFLYKFSIDAVSGKLDLYLY